MLVLRADPWAPDYGMGFEASQELTEETLPRADPFVETEDWTTPRSPAATPWGVVWFVDGVRRIELRLVADEGERRAQGLFGSYAVGSVRCDGRAAFDEHRVCRAVVLGAGLNPDPVTVRVGVGTLRFEPATAVGPDPNAPLVRLQELMREQERALAARLAQDGAPLVLVDGPLRLGEEAGSSAVGVVKRFVRRYLEPEQERLLGELGPGERTPVFALLDQGGKLRGYSWYMRLIPMRPAWHDHAGILRCEVRSGVGLAGAAELADRVTAMLPDFAGRPADARSPQNLAPVAGLETWLRHRMGDQGMVRRGLLEALCEQEGGTP
jgi:hypothetical protein